MTSPDPVRAAIVAIFESIPDIGKVNSFERYADRDADLQAAYQASIGGTKQLRGWNVRRTSVRELSGPLGVSLEVAGWTITGYLAINDKLQSELVMDGLIEAARAAVRVNPTLNGTVTDTSDLSNGSEAKETGLQLTESDPVYFAGVLSHRVVLSLLTSRAIQY